MSYRIFEHTADIGIEVHGKTLVDLFAQAACALVDLLTDRSLLAGETERIIHVKGTDREEVLINYLREVLYLFTGENYLIQDIQAIEFTVPQWKGAPFGLEASLRGTLYDPGRHTLKREIKAVTYHRAEVRKTPEGWHGLFIVDV